MHVLRVGSPYIEGQTEHIECVEYNYRSRAHAIKVSVANLTERELDCLAAQSLRFFLGWHADVRMIMLSMATNDEDYFNMPYTWHLVPSNERDVPDLKKSYSALVSLVVIEATTGIVKVLRLITWPSNFVTRINYSIAAQTAVRWTPHLAQLYDKKIEQLFNDYDNMGLARLENLAYCVGGQPSPGHSHAFYRIDS